MNDHWFHEHWEMVVAGTAVAWALIVWLMKSAWFRMTSHFATEGALKECHGEVHKRIDDVREQLRGEIGKVRDDLSHEMLVSRQINTSEHDGLRELFTKLRDRD